jgi:hypothetical protein
MCPLTNSVVAVTVTVHWYPSAGGVIAEAHEARHRRFSAQSALTKDFLTIVA